MPTKTLTSVPGTLGNLLVKSKMSPSGGSAALRQFNPKTAMKLKFFSDT